MAEGEREKGRKEARGRELDSPSKPRFNARNETSPALIIPKIGQRSSHTCRASPLTPTTLLFLLLLPSKL